MRTKLCVPAMILGRALSLCAPGSLGCAPHAEPEAGQRVEGRGSAGEQDMDAASGRDGAPSAQAEGVDAGAAKDAGRVGGSLDARPPVYDGEVAREAGVRDGAAGEALTAALREAGVVALFPAPGSEGVCPDLALRIAFATPAMLGKAGKVHVFDSARPETPAASLDLAAAMTSQTIGGASLNLPRQAYVEGDGVVLYLPPPGLSYGREYFVRIEAGAVITPSGAALAIGDDASWRFRTQPAAPKDRARLRVALDGSGDFCSLQGALDALAGFQGSAQITIARGTYHGPVRTRDKRDLTLSGEERKATVLTGVNNEALNPGTAKRALISIENSRNIVLEKLTIRNLTPQGGSQAEALRLDNCDACSLREADVSSLQDTLLWSGRIHARDVLITGNVDFIWGAGTAYFERSEIRTSGRKGYTVQARNTGGSYGYVFVDSKLTSDPGISGHFLARVDANVYPESHVAFIDCELGDHIDPAGFLVSAGSTAGLRFWEYRSKAANGAPIDVSKRASFVKQLSSQEAAEMRDAQVVLRGWAP